MKKEKQYIDVNPEQMGVVLDFLSVIFEDDVENYWNLISKVDQARVYGMYRAALSLDLVEEQLSFKEYVEEQFMKEHRKQYEKLRNNDPGIASHLRYTEDGECLVYVLPSVTEVRIVKEPTQEYVFPVTLTMDTNVENGEITSEWKVRMYSDQEYKYL